MSRIGTAVNPTGGFKYSSILSRRVRFETVMDTSRPEITKSEEYFDASKTQNEAVELEGILNGPRKDETSTALVMNEPRPDPISTAERLSVCIPTPMKGEYDIE